MSKHITSFDKFLEKELKGDPSLKDGIKKAGEYIDLMIMTYVNTPTFTKKYILNQKQK